MVCWLLRFHLIERFPIKSKNQSSNESVARFNGIHGLSRKFLITPEAVATMT